MIVERMPSGAEFVPEGPFPSARDALDQAADLAAYEDRTGGEARFSVHQLGPEVDGG